MLFAIVCSLLLMSSSALCVQHDHKPSRRHKLPSESEQPQNIPHRQQPLTPSTPLQTTELDLTPDETMAHLEEEFRLLIAPEDAGVQAPLAAICSEINDYCSYFLEHSMDSLSLQQHKNALRVFCALLQLLTHLANSDYGTVRLNAYFSSITTIAQSLNAAGIDDATITTHYAHFPFALALHTQCTEEAQVVFLVHHALRTADSGIPLIRKLFQEITTYLQYKLHATMRAFRSDTESLLERAQHPELSAEEAATLSVEERKTLSSLSWLCRQAATTCADVAQALPSAPLLAHTQGLIVQVQQMLATMALTYNHLGTNSVRSNDKHSLAYYYAHMVSALPSIIERRGAVSLINYVKSFNTVEERQALIETIFSNENDSKRFLQEFFPSFSDTLDANLTALHETLTTQVIEVLNKRCWILPS